MCGILDSCTKGDQPVTRRPCPHGSIFALLTALTCDSVPPAAVTLLNRAGFSVKLTIARAITGLAFLGSWSASADAATFDLDFAGAVISGTDSLGLFGTAGNSLLGDSFNGDFFYSIPPATYQVLPQSVQIVPVTYSLTINGQTVTSSAFGSPFGTNVVVAGTAVGQGDSYGVIQGNVTTLSAELYTNLNLTLLSNILYPNGTQPNLLIPFVYAPQSGDIVNNNVFTVNNPNIPSNLETVTFSFSSISLTEVSSVPLPPTWVLMLTGFGVLGLLRAHRKRQGRDVAVIAAA
jgi:hypothetical protein